MRNKKTVCNFTECLQFRRIGQRLSVRSNFVLNGKKKLLIALGWFSGSTDLFDWLRSISREIHEILDQSVPQCSWTIFEEEMIDFVSRKGTRKNKIIVIRFTFHPSFRLVSFNHPPQWFTFVYGIRIFVQQRIFKFPKQILIVNQLDRFGAGYIHQIRVIILEIFIVKLVLLFGERVQHFFSKFLLTCRYIGGHHQWARNEIDHINSVFRQFYAQRIVPE